MPEPQIIGPPQITQNIYDTDRGQQLLIPHCSRLIGRLQSEIPFGQDRALVARA